MKSVDFLLKSPLKYSLGGEFKDGQILQLIAPNLGSSLVKKNARKLRDLSARGEALAQKLGLEMRRAMGDEDEKPEKEPDLSKLSEDDKKKLAENREKEKQGRYVLVRLAVSGSDTNEMCEAMKALAPAVISIEDTEVKLSPELWEKLDMQDQEEITGVYLTAFFA